MIPLAFDMPIHRWRREDYERLVERGLLDGQHVELMDGYIVDMTPIGPSHVVAVMLLDAALTEAFDAGYIIRQRAPLANRNPILRWSRVRFATIAARIPPRPC